MKNFLLGRVLGTSRSEILEISKIFEIFEISDLDDMPKICAVTKIIKTYFLHSEKTFGAFSDGFMMVSDKIQVS